MYSTESRDACAVHQNLGQAALDLRDAREVRQHIGQQLRAVDGALGLPRRDRLKLGVAREIQQSAGEALFIHPIGDDILESQGIQTHHGVATGPGQTIALPSIGAIAPQWRTPLNQHGLAVERLAEFHRARIDPTAIGSAQHKAGARPQRRSRQPAQSRSRQSGDERVSRPAQAANPALHRSRGRHNHHPDHLGRRRQHQP